MSKADRALKLSRGNNSQSEEENSNTLPRINTKTSLNNVPESYNFMNSAKKNTSSKESLTGLLSKDMLVGLSQQERALVDELTRKIEDQRKEIDQRSQTLMAVQRNFEGISSLLKKEKDLGGDNKKKVAALTEENAKLTEENRLLGRRIDDMIERLNKYEHELDHNAKDKKKINQTLEEQELLKSKIQDLQNQLEKKKKEVIDLDTKNRNMLAQVDKFKKIALGLEEEKQKSFLQYKEARNEIIMFQTENDRLHKIIVEYKVKQGDIDKLKDEYQALLAKKSEIEKESKEYLREVSELRSEVNQLRAQNKKLEEGLQSQAFQLKFGNSKEETFREDIKELKKQLENKEIEITETNTKLSELQKNLQDDRLYYSSYKSLIERYDVLKKYGTEISLIQKPELDKLKSDFAEISELTKDYEDMKKRLEKLKSDMERKNEMMEVYIADKKFDNEKMRALEEENKRLASHSQKLTSALNFKNENEKLKDGQFNNEIETLRKKLDANISTFGDINAKNKNIVNERDTMSKQIDDLKSTIAQKEEEISQLKSTLDGITQGNKSSQQSVQALQKEIKDLKSSIEINESQIEALKKLNNTLTSENQEITKKLKEAQDKTKSLSDQNENLTVKNNEANLALRQSSDNLATANQTIKKLQSSLGDLQGNFDEAMKKIAGMDEESYKKRLVAMEEREKAFNKVIAKMDHAQTSLLISLSCCECMNYLKNPITLLPCGHNYCEKCVPKGNCCKECGGKEVEYSYKNKLLDDVIAKVSYNQVTLESLKPDANK